ncbi:MAG: tyrosine-type recombinase/integrase [Nitrososphaeraceae archaeon]
MGYFFGYLNIDGDTEECFEILTRKAKADITWLVNGIFRYLQVHKGRVEHKEISTATLRNYIKPIRLYCDQMDIPIPWKKLLRGMPKGRRYANDRAPTLDEIKRVLAYPDRRIKPIVCVMSSSGIRLSAWDYLKWKHIIPLSRNGRIVAAKILVYAEDDDEYFSFISQEAFEALQDWINYRKASGEEVTSESWLMRNLWDVTTPKGKGAVTIPKRLKATGIKRLIERALWAQGIRSHLGEGRRRHEFQADHGFRKWFKTRCESAGMRSINIETLMGHSLGLSDSYYRPTEEEILNDYLLATQALNLTNLHGMQEKLEELIVKTEDSDRNTKGQLEEKDQAIVALSDQVMKLSSEIDILKNKIRM